MTWPTSTPNTTNIDAAGDSPALARADLLAALQAITAIINNGEPALKADFLAALFGRVIDMRLFTRSDNGSVYTPTTGTKRVLVFVQSAGGSSGAIPAVGSGQWVAVQGAAAGKCAIGLFSTGFSGVTLTIGASVAPTTGNNGITGGSSSFGSLLSATGGAGSAMGVAIANSIQPVSGAVPATGTSAGALWAIQGGHGGRISGSAGGLISSGDGGDSLFGRGGVGQWCTTSLAFASGLSGDGYGQGASGGVGAFAVSAQGGVKGGDGCILVVELG